MERADKRTAQENIMPIKSVKVDTRELERAFKQIEKKLPSVTAKAINETAVYARKNAEKQTAQDLKVPLKLIRKRLNVNGEVKGDRSTLIRAYRNRLAATLDVYMRGIPVGQIANKPTKRQRTRPGVKAKGGRFYQGAFYAPGAAPHGFIFKRRSNKRLMMPKVGVRKRLSKHFEYYILGTAGTNEFKKRWNRLANYELSKI